MWILRGQRAEVPSAGQNRRVATFGALDATTGELSILLADKKRSVEFLEFLDWLVNRVYAGYDHLYLFLDNCSIHKTKKVFEFLGQDTQRISVIWNAPYAPNLNDIERVWGQLKRSAIDNYYFGDVDHLEDAILGATNTRNKEQPKKYRLNKQSFMQAA